MVSTPKVKWFQPLMLKGLNPQWLMVSTLKVKNVLFLRKKNYQFFLNLDALYPWYLLILYIPLVSTNSGPTPEGPCSTFTPIVQEPFYLFI